MNGRQLLRAGLGSSLLTAVGASFNPSTRSEAAPRAGSLNWQGMFRGPGYR